MATEETGITADAKAAIGAEIRKQISKWIVGGIVLFFAFAVLGWWTWFKPWLIKEVRGNPIGTVIAVDAREQCPDPWHEFSDLAGRVIVGASGAIAVGDKGGKSQVVIRPDQLPPHEHPVSAVLTSEAFGARRGWTDNDGGWWRGRVWIRPSDSTDNAVEPDLSLKATRKANVQSGTTGQPIELMPPYYALRFCIRD